MDVKHTVQLGDLPRGRAPCCQGWKLDSLEVKAYGLYHLRLNLIQFSFPSEPKVENKTVLPHVIFLIQC